MIWYKACCRVLDHDEVVAYEQHWAGVGPLGLIGVRRTVLEAYGVLVFQISSIEPRVQGFAGLSLLAVQVPGLSQAQRLRRIGNSPVMSMPISMIIACSLLSSSVKIMKEVRCSSDSITDYHFGLVSDSVTIPIELAKRRRQHLPVCYFSLD